MYKLDKKGTYKKVEKSKKDAPNSDAALLDEKVIELNAKIKELETELAVVKDNNSLLEKAAEAKDAKIKELEQAAKASKK